MLLFFKKKMEILLHFQSLLYWKVFKNSKIAQIYYYDPQSAGINLQSPQSDSTPWTLTLVFTHNFIWWHYFALELNSKDRNFLYKSNVEGFSYLSQFKNHIKYNFMNQRNWILLLFFPIDPIKKNLKKVLIFRTLTKFGWW